jgi:hypothetical protein
MTYLSGADVSLGILNAGMLRLPVPFRPLGGDDGVGAYMRSSHLRR